MESSYTSRLLALTSCTLLRKAFPLLLLLTLRVLTCKNLALNQEVKVLVAQSCPTVCHPMGCSLPGSSIHGILQARRLEWRAISYSTGSSQPRDQTLCPLALQADSLSPEPSGMMEQNVFFFQMKSVRVRNGLITCNIYIVNRKSGKTLIVVRAFYELQQIAEGGNEIFSLWDI